MTNGLLKTGPWDSRSSKSRCLGELDGTPRTPQWASEICDVPARDILALAREWAARPSMLATGSMYGVSSAARQPYATEWARLMVLLLAMQGLGKKGVNTWGGASMGPPADLSFKFFGYSDGGWDTFSLVAKEGAKNSVNQKVYRLLLPETVMNPPIEWIGEGFCGQSLEQQFTRNICPQPGPEGAPIKMLYRQGGSYISTMTDTKPVHSNVPASESGICRESGHSLAKRDRLCRHRPAGMQQF